MQTVESKSRKDNCARIISNGLSADEKDLCANSKFEAQDTACESLSAGRWETAAVERALVSRRKGGGNAEEGININCSKHVNTCGENCAATGLGGYWNSSTCIPNGPLFHQRHKLLGNSVEQSGSWTSLSLSFSLSPFHCSVEQRGDSSFVTRKKQTERIEDSRWPKE